MRNVLTLLGVTVVLTPALLQAGNAAWATNAADGAWENGANWIGGSPGLNSGTTSSDIATFSNASTTVAIVPDAGRNIQGITFNNAKCAPYTIGTTNGNKFLLSNGGMIVMASTVATNEIVNAPLELEGDRGTYTFTNASTKTLTLGGVINGVSTAGNTNTLLVNTPSIANTALANTIGDGANGGRLALVKNGSSGTLVLALTNTFSGGITLNAGVISLTPPAAASGPALGTGPLTINGGQFYTYYGLTITATNRQTWNNSFSVNFPAVTFDMGYGAVTMTTNITLTLPGAGWGSPVIVRGNIGESGGSRSLTINAAISNPGYFGPYGSNSYSGGTVLNSGGLRIGHAWALGTGPLLINGGGIQQTSGNALLGVSGITWASNMSLSCTAGAINFGTAPVTIVGARQATIDNGACTIGGTIQGTNASIAIQGTSSSYSGTLKLTASNSFDGGVFLAPGSNTSITVIIDHPYALGSGPLTFNPYPGTGTASGSPRFDNDSAGAITVATVNAEFWNTNFVFVGTKSLHMGSGAVCLGSNGAVVTATINGSILTIGGPITNGTRGCALNKAGAGELVLGGANTYTGGTTVTAGRLTVAAGGTLGAGNVTVGTTTAVLALMGSNAIARIATLTLSTNAAVCVVALSNSLPNVIAKLIVGTNTYTSPGTYGSSTSAARTKIPTSFTGPGMLQIPLPPPTTIFFR